MILVASVGPQIWSSCGCAFSTGRGLWSESGAAGRLIRSVGVESEGEPFQLNLDRRVRRALWVFPPRRAMVTRLTARPNSRLMGLH